MSFKKIFWWWALISVAAVVVTFLIKYLLPGHKFIPLTIPFAYVGVLILLVLYVLTAKKE